MGLSGAQAAYKQARSGIARADSTRADVYLPNLIVLVNGVNIATSVLRQTIHISDRIFDQVNTCTFQVRSSSTFVVNRSVVVALGSTQASKRLFAGVVTQLRKVRRKSTSTARWEFICTDYSRLLDKRLVTCRYPATPAHDVAVDILQTFAPSISTAGIRADLPTVTDFVATNERVSTVLRRLAEQISGATGAAFYVDENKIAHLALLPEPNQPIPRGLSVSTTHYWGYEYTEDSTQHRNRLIVEGQSVNCPIGIPAGAGTIPVEHSQFLTSDGGAIRIGAQLCTYTSIDQPVVPTVNVEGTVTCSGVVQTTAGYLPIVNNDFVFSTGTAWVRVGSQILAFSGSDFAISGTWPSRTCTITRVSTTATVDLKRHGLVDGQLVQIAGANETAYNGSVTITVVDDDTFTYTVSGSPATPATGTIYTNPVVLTLAATGAFGSLSAEIAPGTSVEPLGTVYGVSGLTYAEPIDAIVVHRTVVNDTTAQTDMAALNADDLDGVYEHSIQDGRLSLDGSVAVGQADLDAFSAVSLNALSYYTRDPHARSGRSVELTLFEIAGSLQIQSVEISFERTRKAPASITDRRRACWPIRRVEAAPLLLSSFLANSAPES